MKYNAINLIRMGADSLRMTGDSGTAYALHELANNLLAVMSGNETFEEWLKCYTAQNCEATDMDKLFEPGIQDAEI